MSLPTMFDRNRVGSFGARQSSNLELYKLFRMFPTRCQTDNVARDMPGARCAIATQPF
ncbi:hypothetical protein [Microseira wollei]|uniref:hypothetical protein n=1 Tax=Microseira wollei TaxID=467598 RepID=UPI001CFCB03C|nr:hypothetical protein [Microseira wollei]